MYTTGGLDTTGRSVGEKDAGWSAVVLYQLIFELYNFSALVLESFRLDVGGLFRPAMVLFRFATVTHAWKPFFLAPKVLSAIGSEVSEVLMWYSKLGTPVFFDRQALVQLNIFSSCSASCVEKRIDVDGLFDVCLPSASICRTCLLCLPLHCMTFQVDASWGQDVAAVTASYLRLLRSVNLRNRN